MSLAETIKDGLAEYGFALFPGGIGLKAYYDLAHANIRYFEKNYQRSRMSATLVECARDSLPLILADIASEHFTAFQNISLRQYGLIAFSYLFQTAFWLLILNNLKKGKKDDSDKEKKETKTLDKIIAQHATPAKQ